MRFDKLLKVLFEEKEEEVFFVELDEFFVEDFEIFLIIFLFVV